MAVELLYQVLPDFEALPHANNLISIPKECGYTSLLLLRKPGHSLCPVLFSRRADQLLKLGGGLLAAEAVDITEA